MRQNAIHEADSDSKLTPVQERAIVALMSHATIKGAAKAVGVDDGTLWRWLQNKDFHTAYKELRRESMSQSIARLQQASTDAVSTLRALVKDKKTPAAVRATAAKTILEFSIKATELEDFADRIAQLERAQGGKK